MKEGWEIKSLGDVCDVQRGLTYSGKDTVDISSQIVLRSTNIDLETGKLLFDELKYLREDLEIKPTYFLRKNSLLVCFSSGSKSHLGKVALVNADYPNFYFGGFIGQITPMEPLDPIFLYYCLISESYKDYILNLTDGVNINNLKAVDLKAFQIPLPPLSEQQRIVSILDKAFAAIDQAKANAEQNLKNAKELFESYLQGVFGGSTGSPTKRDGWEEKTIKELTTVLGDGLHGTPKYTIEGEYHFINGNNLTDGVIELKENTKRVSVEEYKKYKKNLTDRTVLVSINGTLGNVAFYNGEKIILGKSACYFNLKASVDKDFVKYVLTSPYFLQYAHKEATGATIKNVSLKTMREFVVPLPDLKTQQTIVRQLDDLRAETQKLEAVYQKKMDDLEEMKKSILQKAFAGELDTSASSVTKEKGVVV